MTPADPRVGRLVDLVRKAVQAPRGVLRIACAIVAGVLCHGLFALGAGAMMVSMYHGLALGLGELPWPWALATNALLMLQFPLAHSFLLTGSGNKLLCRLLPGSFGRTLSTTTYVIIASGQLLMLFALWTPSGIVLWQAEGPALWVLSFVYGFAWLLLAKASFDAGLEVQSGALGWMSLLGRVKPVFPDMPTLGLFRIIRQPIYAAFTLTLWTVPVWTPDQLALAITFTAYCVLAPRLKERRFARRYGDRFESYQASVPYFLPRLTKRSMSHAK